MKEANEASVQEVEIRSKFIPLYRNHFKKAQRHTNMHTESHSEARKLNLS